jgi:hypothetical protein
VIISQLTQANAALAARVPELEAAQASEDHAENAAEPQVVHGHTNTEPAAHSGTSQQRPWWRRMFGG